ncbi:hypothetical protein TNCT6_69280 [Streptomyces sp. 6-11-2]|nr:hypothetical protein TNCT6_69280 [Streptomyces sp. 6-11-2]
MRHVPSRLWNASSSVSPTENQGTYTRLSMACTVADRLPDQAEVTEATTNITIYNWSSWAAVGMAPVAVVHCASVVARLRGSVDPVAWAM